MRPSGYVGTTLLAHIAVLAAGAQSRPANWPIERSTHTMVWHEGLQEALLIGGVERQRDSAMWSWNGTRWMPRATGGPAGRGHAAMSYDSHRNRVVLHGGFVAVFGTNNPQGFGDTWEWDGRTWRSLGDGGPGLRDHHAMVYDPVRRVTLMFGGHDPRATPGASLSDTWSWNGKSWRKLADDGPPARSTHRMIFDSKRNRIVMFGGWGPDNQSLSDTWAWDGQRWSKLNDSGPSPRFAMRMAYDASRDRIVLFGGRGQAGDLADTWEFDGERWSQVNVAGPALRNIHEMVYDNARNAVLLFGGFSAPRRYDDFWKFTGNRWTQVSRPDAASGFAVAAPAGNGTVGYRVINHWDRSRSTAPSHDFEGRPNAGERAVPMQVSMWYPASGGGTPMRVGTYHALSGKAETLGDISDADVQGTTSRIASGMQFAIGTQIPQRTADSIRDSRTLAFRDATAATGRFPIVLMGGNATSTFGLAEYLASHGYVVMSVPSVGTAAQQVNRVQVAMETHTRNLETLWSIAATQPNVDPMHVALVGINFDGLAALTLQMRNMNAAAVVSLDGYETKTNTAAGLRASPYFDPARMRVPYLSFAQDNPPTPTLAFSDSLARQLAYAQRYAYVVRDMEHVHLLGNLLVYPQLRAEQRLGYDFVWRTTRSFLDAFVKGDTGARAFVDRTAVQNGYPAWLVKTELKLAALPAVPTSTEVEQIVMSGDIAKLRRVFMTAREANPNVRLFTNAELNLFAFRFTSRGDRSTAIDILRLATEAFPGSSVAHNNLGNAYRDNGNIPQALQSWQRFLEVAPTDPELGSEGDRAQSIANIQAKIRQHQR
jgi:hypothetical protein